MLLEEQVWPGRSGVWFSIGWYELSISYPIRDVLKEDGFMKSDFGNEVWAGKNEYNHRPIDDISHYDNEFVHQESEWSLRIDHHQGLNPRMLTFKRLRTLRRIYKSTKTKSSRKISRKARCHRILTLSIFCMAHWAYTLIIFNP